MTGVIPEQVGKLLPLLGSDKDGEVVATARAIQRTLKGAGLDLHDLVRAIALPASPFPTATPRGSETYPSWRAPRGYMNPDWNLVQWCLERDGGHLPARDRAFLIGIGPRLQHRGGRLSDRQRLWLEDIRIKITARAA